MEGVVLLKSLLLKGYMKNMSYENDTQLSVWRRAGEALGVAVQAPFVFVAQNDCEFRCVAFFPDFGGPAGMLVAGTRGPEYETSPELLKAAASAGLYCSFVNSDVYCIFDENLFKELLRDWGFFGKPDERPTWL